MTLQKYRADFYRTQPDGAKLWFAKWFGGPTLAKIQNCAIEGTEKHLTVYVTGEHDSFFSQPAATRYKGRYVGGYITGKNENLVFRPLDRFRDRFN